MASDFEVIENSMKAQNKFGHCYGSETYIITKEDIQALLEGKQLAATINDEYSLFIILDEEEE